AFEVNAGIGVDQTPEHRVTAGERARRLIPVRRFQRVRGHVGVSSVRMFIVPKEDRRGMVHYAPFSGGLAMQRRMSRVDSVPKRGVSRYGNVLVYPQVQDHRYHPMLTAAWEYVDLDPTARMQ